MLNQENNPDPFRLEEAIHLLEATPEIIRTLVQGVSEDWLHFKEDPEAWSPHDVLIHFIHNELANWVPRIRVILSDQPERKFVPFNQMPEGDERSEGDSGRLAAQFSELRGESLAILRGLNLSDEQLAQTGEHPRLGVVTLRNLLATWTVHDLNHLYQITKSLAKRYQESVGPWKGFLGILDL